VFTSHRDALVLGLGTFLFGTVEGAHGEAAGLSGFRRPAKADRQSYAKLVHRPYRRDWLAYGNSGGHFGALSASFAAYVLAPVLHGSDDLAKAADGGANGGAAKRRSGEGRGKAADETSNQHASTTPPCGGHTCRVK
jgi:hypothetical protein